MNELREPPLAPDIDNQFKEFIGGHNEALARLVQRHIERPRSAIAEDYWIEAGKKSGIFDPSFVKQYPYDAMFTFFNRFVSSRNLFILTLNAAVPHYNFEVYDLLDEEQRPAIIATLRENLDRLAELGSKFGLPTKEPVVYPAKAIKLSREMIRQAKEEAVRTLKSAGFNLGIDEYLKEEGESVLLNRHAKDTQLTAALLGVSVRQLAETAAVYQGEMLVRTLRAFTKRGYTLEKATTDSQGIATADIGDMAMKTIVVSALNGIWVFGHELPPIITSPSSHFLNPMYQILRQPTREYVCFNPNPSEEQEFHDRLEGTIKTLDFPSEARQGRQGTYPRAQFDPALLSPGHLLKANLPIFYYQDPPSEMYKNPNSLMYGNSNSLLNYLLPISVAVLKLPPRAVVK